MTEYAYWWLENFIDSFLKLKKRGWGIKFSINLLTCLSKENIFSIKKQYATIYHSSPVTINVVCCLMIIHMDLPQ